jgi:hypothetical protein
MRGVVLTGSPRRLRAPRNLSQKVQAHALLVQPCFLLKLLKSNLAIALFPFCHHSQLLSLTHSLTHLTMPVESAPKRARVAVAKKPAPANKLNPSQPRFAAHPAFAHEKEEGAWRRAVWRTRLGLHVANACLRILGITISKNKLLRGSQEGAMEEISMKHLWALTLLLLFFMPMG